MEHQAIAIQITEKLNDRIGIDIVGGFPTTTDGYCRILVIVQFLSKMIRLYALKSKSAEEVAEKLWCWITTFGPPNCLKTPLRTSFISVLFN